MENERGLQLGYGQLRSGQDWIESQLLLPLLRDIDRRLTELEIQRAIDSNLSGSK